jgi:DNA-binding winged helix-turn-helix (wHTH) protein
MSDAPTILRFGPYELDEARLELRHAGAHVRIQTPPLALLAYLVRHRERVVSHAEILRHVWAGVHVEPGALKSAIHALRRALPDDGERPWIVSIHGQGYRFAGSLHPERRESDFIAREAELDALRELCQTALGGEPRVALIGGPPGVGKTRIAMELAREAEALGFETRIGRTHAGAGAPPFWPWAQIVRGWTLSHGAERLAALAAESGATELLGLAATPQAGGSPLSYTLSGRAQFRTLESVARFLERASRERPQLLILDDLHRADPASLELLAFLSQHVVHTRLLVLVTHRPLEPGHLLGRMLQRAGTRSISLGGLPRAAVARVLAQSLGREAAAETIDRVHARSGGNPLFVYELARALAAGEPRDAAVPSRVHDAVRARIGECSPACAKLLCLASAAEVELTLPLLREALAAELGSATLLDALDEVERRDLLTCSGGTYRFVHGIVREALQARLGAGERAQLRRQLDDALAARRGSDRCRVLALDLRGGSPGPAPQLQT